jgi:hypothetical protein
MDTTTGLRHDYRRRDGLIATGLEGWQDDAEILWSCAEAAERHPRAVTARSAIIALPAELSDVARRRLAQRIAKAINRRWGVAVEWAIHSPDPAGDGRNHHLHLQWTTRQVDELIGFDTVKQSLGAKTRLLDDRRTSGAELRWLRREWASIANAELAAAGVDARIDMTTRANGERRGQRHIGPAAMGRTRRRRRRAHEAAPAKPGTEDQTRAAMRPGAWSVGLTRMVRQTERHAIRAAEIFLEE